MEKKNKRVIAEVEKLSLDILEANNEIRIDSVGRCYGLGDFINRCARRLGGGKE